MQREGLRPSDVGEIKRSTRAMPGAALFDSYQVSHPFRFTITADETPCAMFGMCPDGRGGASIWLLATPTVQTIRPFTFLRKSREWVDWMASLYQPLYNMVDAENLASIQWLKGCGFTIKEPELLNGFPFHYFWR